MPEDHDHDETQPGPLTELEIKKIRRIIIEEDRSRWFWREARRWGGYGAAAVGTIYASWEFIERVVAAFMQSMTRGSP